MDHHTERVRAASSSIGAAAAWAVVYLIALFVMKTYHPVEWLRILLSFLPAIPFAFFLAAFGAEIRIQDELHRRVHQEALALAFPLTILLFMVLSLLTQAAVVSTSDWTYQNIWYFMPLLYAIGLAVAWRRYR